MNLKTKVDNTIMQLIFPAIVAGAGIGGLLCYDILKKKLNKKLFCCNILKGNDEQQAQKDIKYGVPKPLRESPYGKEVEIALMLAFQAGANMRGYCDDKGTENEKKHDLGIQTKSQPTDLCTKIDLMNERLVIDGLMKHFPNHKVIGEESVGTGTIPPLTKDPTWIIDPIDGTTNFAHGFPLTCVSIGYCVDGIPVAGIVYAPMTDEVYLAVRGYGAFRNGIRITKRSDEGKTLEKAVVVYEMGYVGSNDDMEKMLAAVSRLYRHGCQASRSLGSGVLDLCYVATGRVDCIYTGIANEGWKPWDYCAGSVVMLEAGCIIESIDQKEGDAFDLYSKSMIAAPNVSMLRDLREICKA